MLVAATVLTTIAAFGWEIACRRAGYAPTLNDTADLWAQQREAVRPDSIVIVGDSRPLYDLDLDTLEKGLGQRPLQLSLVGSCAYPVLADLAADETFRGTVLCSVVPLMFFAPGGPLLANAEKAINRHRNWTLAQRSGHALGMLLEERIAFLQQEDLTLAQLLLRLPIPNRPQAQVGPRLPPYFQTTERDRQTRMTETAAKPGPLQDRIKFGWIPFFTPPPPPSFIPKEAFLAAMGRAIEARFGDAAAAVEKIRQRGGKVVFIRFPVSGEVKKIEDQATPKVGHWTRLLKESGAPGIYFEDHPELASFECPEWSHLSAPDAVLFSERLVPHLRTALGR